MVSSDSIISKTIRNGQWERVKQVISRDPHQARKCAFFCCSECKHPHSHCPLLYACALDPPLSVVKSLVEAHPQGLSERDCEGKLPLHISCEYGASPEVIAYLVARDCTAVRAIDNNGRYPLHLACFSYVIGYADGKGKDDVSQSTISNEDIDDMHDTLLILLNVAPDLIVERDYDDTCPIEYSIISDCPEDIVLLLQKTAEKSRKRRTTQYVSI